jgi:threonine dehydrogenase-like Zn-dependent dehydrogenase
MRAITVIPGEPGSAELSEVADPVIGPGQLLVETLALGMCGTDREIVAGDHGEPPPGRERLILGHELLGRVSECPEGCGFNVGDLVAGVVRRPDPVPCGPCGRGEWDMCRNGLYTERGIKGLDGYGAELITLESDFAIRVDHGLGKLGVLTEPASVVAKAWEQIDRIAQRASLEYERALITGAGPIGLLAALMAAQRGLEVHVLDHAEGGVKPRLAKALGAKYHTSTQELPEPDVVVECTGVAELVADAMQNTAPGAIVCLAGVAQSRRLTVDIGALNNELVLENDVVFGSVNANLRHFEAAGEALAEADRSWLESLITRTVPLERWQEGLDKQAGDVKVVVDFDA